jgi:DHA2 family multidrug resistance protein
MSAEASGAQEWRPSVNPWIVAGAVMLATFMEVLDTTIVSVALPNMAGSLASTNDEATWVLTSYLVANAVVLPASGWFSLRFGRKRFLLACTGLFTFASLLCAMAPSIRGMSRRRASVASAAAVAIRSQDGSVLVITAPPRP